MALHILTVDVEDWPQSTLDHSLPIGDRVVGNTHALLDLISETGARGTFFVLGKVAEKHPSLARQIVDAGHEVGTHGYSHESVENMPLEKFKGELHRSVEILRQQTGRPVLGHRAADFSISSRSFHLFECLSEEGLTYDSSIFPILHRRYGVSGAWKYPHYIRCQSGKMLMEFPLATFSVGNIVLPGAGGGYLRLFPYWWTAKTLRFQEQAGSPATCYLHPYEIDQEEMSKVPYRIPPLLRLSQGLNRRSIRPKLKRLFSEWRFVSMGEMVEKLRRKNLQVGLNLGCSPVVYAPN